MTTFNNYQLLTILGATASGKTGVATHCALKLNGEIISGDSRQVYKGMDLGTGKDIEEYTIDGVQIPYHLIDIEEAGAEYNVFRFQCDFMKAYNEVQSHNKLPILCGGSGMYLESVLKNYRLIQVPKNEALREELSAKTIEELGTILKSYKETLHNSTDLETKRRAIRAIEIEDYMQKHPELDESMPKINSLNIGILFSREDRRERISIRLKQRLEEGMLDEVRALLDNGVSPEQLIYYGLEYKFLTQHIIGELSYEEMYNQLEIAIHQFAKRQMTWYRRMEKNGIKIHWIDGQLPIKEKFAQIKELF